MSPTVVAAHALTPQAMPSYGSRTLGIHHFTLEFEWLLIFLLFFFFLLCCLVVPGQENQPGVQLRILGDSRLCILYSEIPIKGGGVTYNLNQALLSFCARHRMKHLFVVDGVPTTNAEELKEGKGDKLRFLTTSTEFSKHMKDNGHGAIMNAMMPGYAGQLLADATVADGLSGMDISCLLAKTDARLPTASSAIHVVKALDGFLDTFEVDVTDLEDSAMEMESAINSALAEARAKMGGAQGKAPSHMYM